MRTPGDFPCFDKLQDFDAVERVTERHLNHKTIGATYLQVPFWNNWRETTDGENF